MKTVTRLCWCLIMNSLAGRERGIMNTNRDLNYRLYVQKMDGFERTPFRAEMEKYIAIQSGDIEQVRHNFSIIRKDFFAGKGKLSDDPIRNVRYHFIISVAMVVRICVEGGLPHSVAYTLSDIYIQRADQCNNIEKLIDMFEEMQLDFASRMRQQKKEKAFSIHIRKCVDYIYDHLHEDLSLKVLAELTDLNASYLSKLFAKETGNSVKEFVLNAKVDTAKNMLKYSDFSSLEISLALGFSSQSAFISTFKRLTGETPKKYRDYNYKKRVE